MLDGPGCVPACHTIPLLWEPMRGNTGLHNQYTWDYYPVCYRSETSLAGRQSCREIRDLHARPPNYKLKSTFASNNKLIFDLIN